MDIYSYVSLHSSHTPFFTIYLGKGPECMIYMRIYGTGLSENVYLSA
jgi:hypothetical protein